MVSRSIVHYSLKWKKKVFKSCVAHCNFSRQGRNFVLINTEKSIVKVSLIYMEIFSNESNNPFLSSIVAHFCRKSLLLFDILQVFIYRCTNIYERDSFVKRIVSIHFFFFKFYNFAFLRTLQIFACRWLLFNYFKSWRLRFSFSFF